MSKRLEKDGAGEVRKVRVLYNPKSGIGELTAEEIRRSLQDDWDVEGIDLTYQVSLSIPDGVAKTRRAVEDGVDTVIVIGGDGMVNSIGSALVGTDTALAVIPAGSGNGFARHFDIPLNLSRAAKALVDGRRMPIDVGFIDGRPFFVTCGLAWDAEIARGFEELPVRGILPYVFSGIYYWFKYEPQHFTLIVDGETVEVEKPVLFTVANLTQYGGGARIAPNAQPDDGLLELVAVPQMDPLQLVTQVHHLFDGSIDKVQEIVMRRFKRMEVHRERPGAVQVDGEMQEMGRDLVIEVKPEAIDVVVPKLREEKKRRPLFPNGKTRTL